MLKRIRGIVTTEQRLPQLWVELRSSNEVISVSEEPRSSVCAADLVLTNDRSQFNSTQGPASVCRSLRIRSIFQHLRVRGVIRTLPVLFPSGRSPSQVWSIRGDPVGRAQCDGNHVLVTTTGQAGQLGQRDPVLHGTPGGKASEPLKRNMELLFW